MKNKMLFIAVAAIIMQLVSVTESSVQLQAFNLDVNVKEEFAVLYLKMKNEFQVTDAKLQIGRNWRDELDTMERRLRTLENQADILNYMHDQGWNLHESQFSLNNNGQIYPFAYMVHIYRRNKK